MSSKASTKTDFSQDRRGEIGVLIHEIYSPEAGVHGLKITHIISGSPAEKSGLQVGDIILRMNGIRVVNRQRIAKELATPRPGDQIRIQYFRDSKEIVTVVNLADRMKVYLRAAEADDAYAQMGLGEIYRRGYGISKDEEEADKWYRKAVEQFHRVAELGDLDAQNSLGVIYENGRGVKKDEPEAVKWYRKAAEQGYVDAQHNLGRMYFNGFGLERNESEAVEWYRKAADQGDSDSQGSLGWMYLNGRGVQKDETEALKWYRIAANQGNDEAQFFAGLMYFEGKGIAKDQIEAYKWFTLAASQGNENARRNMLISQQLMSREQIARAEEEAKIWAEKNNY
ncbi:MAG: PDZ domain-containing protein [Nitrospiria bacterium]